MTLTQNYKYAKFGPKMKFGTYNKSNMIIMNKILASV